MDDAYWVCAVCCRRASDSPGTCPRCESMLSFTLDPETVQVMAHCMRTRAKRLELVRVVGALTCSAITAGALCWLFDWRVLPERGIGLYSSTFVDLTLAFFVIVGLASFSLVRPVATGEEPHLWRSGLRFTQEAWP